jgi:hypothetical protein
MRSILETKKRSSGRLVQNPEFGESPLKAPHLARK